MGKCRSEMRLVSEHEAHGRLQLYILPPRRCNAYCVFGRSHEGGCSQPACPINGTYPGIMDTRSAATFVAAR